MLFDSKESSCTQQHLLRTIICTRIILYLSQIAKCICLTFQNAFVSNCKHCCILHFITPAFTAHQHPYSNYIVFVSNWKMYLSDIAKCICIKLQNVLYFIFYNTSLYCAPASALTLYCICLKLQKVFVWHYKIYLYQIANCVVFYIL